MPAASSVFGPKRQPGLMLMGKGLDRDKKMGILIPAVSLYNQARPVT